MDERPGGASLVSVNVGRPRDVEWQGRTVHTGVWKQPVAGPAMVRRLNIDGDGQGDLAGHGGEQRAVLVYQLESYAHWAQWFGRDDFTHGQFGENFTVDGLPDDEVCIGDRYRIGEAELEVTQPRVTCYRVGLRMGAPQLPALLVSHRRPGFYLRVISEGQVRAGDVIVKTASGPDRLTVAETDALLYLPERDPARLRLALQIPALSPGWQQSFRDLLGGAVDAASTPRSEAAWTGFRSLRVSAVVPETATVTSIELVSADGAVLPPARAGQYLAVRIAALGQPAPVRSYSLSSSASSSSSSPGPGTYRISVKHEPHGIVSGYLQSGVAIGATLEVAAPRGTFVLDDDDQAPLLLVSAGIGVTPVLAMLHHLVEQRSRRDVWWIHGARRPAEQALAVEAHDLLAQLPFAHEHVFFSAATPEEGRAHHAIAGRVGEDELRRLAPPVEAAAYLCGPDSFMTAVEHALAAIGLDPARIHTERFGARSPINPGVVAGAVPSPHLPAGVPASGPLVTFARSGLAAPFGPPSATLLELAEACAVSSRWSCRSGVCHTCSTPLLSGAVSYDPEPLDAPAAGEVLLCCAQPRADVVLDL